MKKTFFITIFITTHICFLFLQIQMQMDSVKESFRKQKNEQTLTKLQQEEQALKNKLQVLQNKHDIKEFAQKKLNLEPINLTQIERLSDDNE